jgi:hypothetical protein
LIVAKKDGDLIENQLVYLLGKPLQRPGSKTLTLG